MGSVIGLSTNGDDDDVVSVASRTTTSTMFHRDKIAVPPDGVRISFMEHFIEENGGEEQFARMKTRDVVKKFIKPVTYFNKTSYCALLTKNYPEYVGEASVYVSHAWDSVFLDIYRALKYKYQTNLKTVVWLDIFSINQHMDLIDTALEAWLSLLKSTIDRIGNTVVILSPWENSPVFIRAWCLYEIYCTIEGEGLLEWIMSPNEWDYFNQMIRENSRAAINLFKPSISFEDSETSIVDDKLGIRYTVEAKLGLQAANEVVARRVCEWTIDLISQAAATEVDGDNHFEMTRALSRLYQEHGDFESAEPLLHHVLEIIIEKKGRDNEEALKESQTLGHTYYKMHNYIAALKMFEDCIQPHRDRLGETHPETVSCTVGLADTLYMLDKKQQAEVLYERNVTVLTETFGTHNLRVVDSILAFAYVLFAREAFAKAEKWYIVCVTEMKVLLDDDHASVHLAKSNLAAAFEKQGKYNSAEALLLECIPKLRIALGADNPNVVDCIMTLANIYYKLGRINEAEPLYEEYVSKIKDRLGMEHPNVLVSITNLACFYYEQQKTYKLEPLYIDCLKISRVLSGEDSLVTIECDRNLADLYYEQGLYADAERLYLICLDKMRTKMGNDHVETQYYVDRLGALYASQGRFGKAEPMLLEAVQTRWETLGGDHSYTRRSVNTLANFYAAHGDMDKEQEIRGMLKYYAESNR